MATPLPVGRTAEQLDVAHRGCDQSEQHADQRRLARAVGTEQADDLPGPDAHRDVVDRDEPSERATDLIGPEQHAGVDLGRTRGRHDASSRSCPRSSDRAMTTSSRSGMTATASRGTSAVAGQYSW